MNIIFAQSRNKIIGNNGKIPWHIPEDLANFKRLTQGCAVVMGRKTWDSLPEKFRPLPGRRNIVISRTKGWTANGALSVSSIEDAAKRAGDLPIWVIGGLEIYNLAMPYAKKLVVTQLYEDYDGDTPAPVLDDTWGLRESTWHTAKSTVFSVLTYRRIQ